MAEWRHGLVVVLPGSLAEALAYASGCVGEPAWSRRLCLEEAAVETLALALEERNPGWRRRGLRAAALLEMAARYLGWLAAGSEDEETRRELARRAYNAAAAAYFSRPRGMKSARELGEALGEARRLLDAGAVEEAAALLSRAVRAAGVDCCGTTPRPPPEGPGGGAARGEAYGRAALARPP